MPMTPTRSARRLLAAAILVAVPFGVAACGGDDEKATDTTADRSTTSAPDSTSALAVSDAWARTATAGGNGAVYMMIAGGDAEDALVSATVPADLADRVELHETVAQGSGMESTTSMTPMTPSTAMGDGADATGSTVPAGEMMKMQKVDKIEIPAGETVKLEPGGYHIMLMGLAGELAEGSKITITLTFAEAGEKTVEAEVRAF